MRMMNKLIRFFNSEERNIEEVENELNEAQREIKDWIEKRADCIFSPVSDDRICIQLRTEKSFYPMDFLFSHYSSIEIMKEKILEEIDAHIMRDKRL